MTYYINPIWFYLMNTCSALRVLLFILGAVAIFTFIFILLIFFANGCYMDEDEENVVKACKKFIICCLIGMTVGVFLPSKETCLEMMVASQVTHENVENVKEEIIEIVDYVTDKINED